MFADRISKTINKTVQVFLAESPDFGGAIVHPQDKILEVFTSQLTKTGLRFGTRKSGLYFIFRNTTLGWGKSVVENLSRDIQKEFPGIKGFGVSNMWDIARFYAEY